MSQSLGLAMGALGLRARSEADAESRDREVRRVGSYPILVWVIVPIDRML